MVEKVKQVAGKMNRWLATLPTTNARIAVSICLSAIYVLTAIFASVLGKALDGTTLTIIGGYLVANLGIDAAQFYGKRKTHIPSLPDSEE